MAIEIKVPSVGESIQEVTLAKWLRKEGEWVERDEVIAELESEKASFEVNAEQAGAVQLIAKEGDSLAIGDLICRIDTEAKRPETIPVQSTANTAKSTAQPTAAVQSEHHASPVAAAIIAEKKLDISTLTPSGTNGKIMKQDVLDALNHPGTQPGLTLSAEMKGLKK